jgi:tetratricopeptide (TPR) repeat protein
MAWEMMAIPDLNRAAMYAERALETEPTHFGALTTAGEILNRLRQPELAIPILRYASERDPLSTYHFDNLADAYLNATQYELAEETIRVRQALESGHSDWGEWDIGLVLLLQGKASQALHHFENISDSHPLRWHGMALALHDLGRTDAALSELAKLLELDPNLPNIHWIIGTAYAWIGEIDNAFGFFEKQREEDIMIFTSMGESPLYTNLLDDSRWVPFLESVNADPDFLASVEFNPRLPSEIRL